MIKDLVLLPWCHAHATTHPGNVRPTNEDRYFLQAWTDGEGILLVVADGIGGNSSGEIAARMAVDTFAGLLDTPLPREPKQQYDSLVERCYIADRDIREKAITGFHTLGMGTTVVAAIITPNSCIHIHAGDSRLYYFKEGEINYRSLDHSMVQLLVETGRIQPEDIPNHPMRSVLNSCLGGKNAGGDFSVDPKWSDRDSPGIILQQNDSLLLCSDGLNNSLPDPVIEDLFQRHSTDPEKLNTELIRAALEKGGEDNITVLTVVLSPR